VPPLTADLGFFPVLLFWAAMMIIGGRQQAKKKREMEERRVRDLTVPEPAEPRVVTHVAPPHPAPAASGMMDELRRAMEELKRAELQTRAHDAAAPPVATPVRVSVTHQQVRRVPDTTRRPIYVEQKPREETSERAFEEGLGARASGLGKAAVPASPATSPQPQAPRSPLAKFADGSPKNALILATILGRPLSDG
jgi:hypothetical protein